VIGQGLRELQEALNRKADAVQREFSATSERLQALSRRLAETRGADREPLIAEQEALHEKQRALADDVNRWRDWSRGVVRQQGEAALRAYLGQIQATNDETVRSAVEQVLYLLDAPEEELARQPPRRTQAAPTTPASRLIARARTEFDLLGKDPAPRRKAAVEFANRPGMAQNEEALAELEAALEADSNEPLVKELVTQTLIQLHRFRAMHLGDLDAVYASVQRLTRFNHPAVIPVLIEVLATPRTGYMQGQAGITEGDNARAREIALARLIEWRTPEAQAAIRARLYDRDPQIVQAAARALESFPGEWT
jgi:hypothetical protein